MRDTKRHFRIALIISVLYVCSIIIYSSFNIETIKNLAPNEFGDFTAGFFSPLALVWLILGYFIQSEELKNSVDALNVQSQELANSVEQYREMVAVDRQRLEFDRQAAARAEQERKDLIKPIFRMREGMSIISGLQRTYNFTLANIGHECRDVTGRIVIEDLMDNDAFERRDHLASHGQINWSIHLNNQYFKEGNLIVDFQDIEGKRHTVAFTVKGDGDEQQFNVKVGSFPKIITDC